MNVKLFHHSCNLEATKKNWEKTKYTLSVAYMIRTILKGVGIDIFQITCLYTRHG